jgi:hypothetical protein
LPVQPLFLFFLCVSQSHIGALTSPLLPFYTIFAIQDRRIVFCSNSWEQVMPTQQWIVRPIGTWKFWWPYLIMKQTQGVWAKRWREPIPESRPPLQIQLCDITNHHPQQFCFVSVKLVWVKCVLNRVQNYPEMCPWHFFS